MSIPLWIWIFIVIRILLMFYRYVRFTQMKYKKNMICSKCIHGGSKPTKIRCSPTFSHTYIFDQSSTKTETCTCPKTKNSTVFHQSIPNENNHNISRIVNKQIPQSKPPSSQLPQKQPASTTKPQHPKKQEHVKYFLNACPQLKSAGSQSKLSTHTMMWFNPDKQLQLQECSHYSQSKDRKKIQLSSNPFNQLNEIPQWQECPQVSNAVGEAIVGDLLANRNEIHPQFCVSIQVESSPKPVQKQEDSCEASDKVNSNQKQNKGSKVQSKGKMDEFGWKWESKRVKMGESIITKPKGWSCQKTNTCKSQPVFKLIGPRR